MARRERPTAAVVLTDEERNAQRWERRRKSAGTGVAVPGVLAWRKASPTGGGPARRQPGDGGQVAEPVRGQAPRRPERRALPGARLLSIEQLLPSGDALGPIAGLMDLNMLVSSGAKSAMPPSTVVLEKSGFTDVTIRPTSGRWTVIEAASRTAWRRRTALCTPCGLDPHCKQQSCDCGPVSGAVWGDGNLPPHHLGRMDTLEGTVDLPPLLHQRRIHAGSTPKRTASWRQQGGRSQGCTYTLPSSQTGDSGFDIWSRGDFDAFGQVPMIRNSRG
jgi:hypothetical protein